MDTKRATPTNTRECPFCAEIIKAKAVKCKHCGSVLTEQAMAMFLHEISRLQSAGTLPPSPGETPAPMPGVPPDLTEAMISSPDVPSSPDSAVRLATILFADVSGFTKMSTQLEAEEMREIMNALFSDLAGAVERFGGKVDKYIGDCVMAVWGTEKYREDDAIRATNAAVSMMHRVKLRAKRLSLPLDMHAGVNTGRVIFGTLGKGHGAAPTVLGDAVNLASRLCSKAPPGQVYVSEATWKRIGNRFGGTPVELDLKGLGLVRAYDVVAARGRSQVTTKHVVTGFLVRDAEVKRIAGVLESLRSNETGRRTTGLLVIGHGGTGKSRLCDYALHHYGAGLKVLFGQAMPSESPVFGVLVTGWLRDLLGGTDGSAIDQFLEERPDLLHFRDALRLVLTTSEELGQKPSPVIQSIDQELAKFFAAASQHAPVVLAGSDVQWADPFSIDLCIALSNTVGGRMALILDGRPGENSDRIKRTTGFESIELRSLSPEEIEIFLASILDELPPPAWIHSLRNRTGGVILHLNQVLNALAEEGALEENPATGKWRLLRISEELPIPQSLADLIWLRIEHLPTWPRETLLHSGVCGLRFPRIALHYAMGRPESDLAPPLETLQSDGFLYVTPEIVAFEHGSIRETARRMLLKNERRKIAERILESLGDRIWSDIFRPLAPDLYRDAGRETDLRTFLSTEAYRLIRAFRIEEARNILDNVGRDPWPDNPQGWQAQSAFLTAKARLAEAEKKTDESLEYLRQAVGIFRKTGGISAELSKTLGLLGRISAKREDWETADRSTREALEISQTLKDEWGAGIHTFMLGWFAELRENWTEALRYYEQSLPLQKNDRGLRIVYGSIARAALEMGDVEKARQRIEASLSIANKDGCLAWNPHAYVSILRTVGRVAWRCGDWQAALGYLQGGLDVARATGDDEAKNFILHPLVAIAKEAGAHDPARVFAEEALTVAKKLRAPRWEKRIQKILDKQSSGSTPPSPEIIERLKAIENSLSGDPPPRESLRPAPIFYSIPKYGISAES